ncbi:MAG: deoxyribose-phosphate aldolase [Candidatus Tenebribacter mawsonii]|nr:deoxyribose-phosphate aldolase [Candidatus Tenebribacter mawsonii]
MKISFLELPRYIDISAVSMGVTYQDVDKVAEIAKKHNCICAFTMPCYTEYLINKLKDFPSIKVGGVVGFPSGADTTNIKLKTVRELINFGCQEIDMVINVGALRSGDDSTVYNEIKSIVDEAAPIPVKSILEISYLTDEEIKRGSLIAANAGVAYVKTGTGWGNKPTTVNTIKLIKEAIGDKAEIKAAGGVRNLKDLETMFDEGCTRFGIGLTSALSILEEAFNRDQEQFKETSLPTNVIQG